MFSVYARRWCTGSTLVTMPVRARDLDKSECHRARTSPFPARCRHAVSLSREERQTDLVVVRAGAALRDSGWRNDDFLGRRFADAAGDADRAASVLPEAPHSAARQRLGRMSSGVVTAGLVHPPPYQNLGSHIDIALDDGNRPTLEGVGGVVPSTFSPLGEKHRVRISVLDSPRASQDCRTGVSIWTPAADTLIKSANVSCFFILSSVCSLNVVLNSRRVKLALCLSWFAAGHSPARKSGADAHRKTRDITLKPAAMCMPQRILAGTSGRSRLTKTTTCGFGTGPNPAYDTMTCCGS